MPKVEFELTGRPVSDSHHFRLTRFLNGDWIVGDSHIIQFQHARICHLFREANQYAHNFLD